MRFWNVMRLILATALLLPAVGLAIMAFVVMSYPWQGEPDSGPLVYVTVGLIYLAVALVLAGGAFVALLGVRLWQALLVLAVVASALTFVPYESLVGLGVAANAAAALFAVAFWTALLYSSRQKRGISPHSG